MVDEAGKQIRDLKERLCEDTTPNSVVAFLGGMLFAIFIFALSYWYFFLNS